jgi:cytochrome c5
VRFLLLGNELIGTPVSVPRALASSGPGVTTRRAMYCGSSAASAQRCGRYVHRLVDVCSRCHAGVIASAPHRISADCWLRWTQNC